MEHFQEFSAVELSQQSNRGKNPFEPYQIRYLGFSFRTKILWFNTGKYRQKISIPDLKIVSKMKGDDTEKVGIAIEGDIQVHCTCPDFHYGGFKYMGTMLDYSRNKETRFPHIRNPKLNGSVCKHLTHLLQELPRFQDAIIRDIEQARRNNYKSTLSEDIMTNAQKLIENVRKGEAPAELIENMLLEFDKYSPDDLIKMAMNGEVDAVLDYLVGERLIEPASEVADKIRSLGATPDEKLASELLATFKMWNSKGDSLQNSDTL